MNATGTSSFRIVSQVIIAAHYPVSAFYDHDEIYGRGKRIRLQDIRHRKSVRVQSSSHMLSRPNQETAKHSEEISRRESPGSQRACLSPILREKRMDEGSSCGSCRM